MTKIAYLVQWLQHHVSRISVTDTLTHLNAISARAIIFMLRTFDLGLQFIMINSLCTL
jgi:hypothetical protein